MTSARTFKTLAYLMGAMTAVTLVLSLIEPLTVSLRTQPATAHAEEPATAMPVLASVPAARWDSLELVLATQDGSKPANLPEAHLIIQPDGRIEATSLWRLGQPLPNHVLRICALYAGKPSDTLLQCWLTACNKAAQQINMHDSKICLSATAQTRSTAQAKLLKEIHHRLSEMLRNWPGA